jgi:hypothetical protein
LSGGNPDGRLNIEIRKKEYKIGFKEVLKGIPEGYLQVGGNQYSIESDERKERLTKVIKEIQKEERAWARKKKKEAEQIKRGIDRLLARREARKAARREAARIERQERQQVAQLRKKEKEIEKDYGRIDWRKYGF